MYQEGELNTPISSPKFLEPSEKPEDQIVREALRYIAEPSDQMIRVNDDVRAVATIRRMLERRFSNAISPKPSAGTCVPLVFSPFPVERRVDDCGHCGRVERFVKEAV